jgi:hypothetical protein
MAISVHQRECIHLERLENISCFHEVQYIEALSNFLPHPSVLMME